MWLAVCGVCVFGVILPHSFFILGSLFSMVKQTCDSITTNCACEAALCVFKAPPRRQQKILSYLPILVYYKTGASRVCLICVSRCRPSSSNCIRCQRIAATSEAATATAAAALQLQLAARVEILKLTPKGGGQVDTGRGKCNSSINWSTGC